MTSEASRAQGSVASRAERSPAAPAVGRAPAVPRTRVAAALALQRRVGNRAAGRILARWIKHPDATKKGVMVPDIVAQEFTRFNPPKNE